MGNSSSSGVAQDYNIGAPMPTPARGVGAPASTPARGVGAPSSTQIGRPIGTDPPASLPLAAVVEIVQSNIRGPGLMIKMANEAENGLNNVREEFFNAVDALITAYNRRLPLEDPDRLRSRVIDNAFQVAKMDYSADVDDVEELTNFMTDFAIIGMASYGYILKSQTPRVMIFVLDHVLVHHNDVVDVVLRGLNMDDWSDNDDEDELEAREEAIANAEDSMARLRREIEERRTVLRPTPPRRTVRLDDESTNAMAKALARALSGGRMDSSDDDLDSDSDW